MSGSIHTLSAQNEAPINASLDSTSEVVPEAGRYHLVVSYACPFSHLVLLARSLKSLEHVVSFSVVEPHLDQLGWRFKERDQATGVSRLAELYHAAAPRYRGPITVPVLWDKRAGRMVSNDSSAIFIMMDQAFNSITTMKQDFRPPDLLMETDQYACFVRQRVNEGVYRAGFARDQQSYDQAVASLFEALDELEELASGDWFLKSRLTEVDLRIYISLIRFDLIYHTHFKCNWRHAYEYPRLWSIVKRLYGMEKVAETTRFQEIRDHYYGSHAELNPRRIVPQGPDISRLLKG